MRVLATPNSHLDPLAIDGMQWLVVRRQRSGAWPPSLQVRVKRLSQETFDFEIQAVGADSQASVAEPEHFAVAACAELVADGYLPPCGTKRDRCLRALTEAVAYVQTHRTRPPLDAGSQEGGAT